ncbi:MAG: thymidine kinase [Patescibacteria group bacterium]|nr:thymidine kinase [Patescibacteria group bacterium]
MRKGSLSVIVGCMSSGKSRVLIHRLKRATYARRKVILFKPERDTRTAEDTAASRDGQEHTAVMVRSAREILDAVDDAGFVEVVGIEEAQLFDAQLIEAVEALVNRGIRVIVAGLDTDYRGQPFGIMPHLLAVADRVTKLSAICIRCGRRATRTQLKQADRMPGDSVILVGGDDLYEARCRTCHEVPR